MRSLQWKILQVERILFLGIVILVVDTAPLGGVFLVGAIATPATMLPRNFLHHRILILQGERAFSARVHERHCVRGGSAHDCGGFEDFGKQGCVALDVGRQRRGLQECSIAMEKLGEIDLGKKTNRYAVCELSSNYLIQKDLNGFFPSHHRIQHILQKARQWFFGQL